MTKESSIPIKIKKIRTVKSPSKGPKEESKESEVLKENRGLFWADRINRACLYLLIFLLPLFFLPFTVNVLDFNKQALLLFLVLLSFLAWLAKALLQGFVRIRLTFLYIPIAILLLVVLLSGFFSLYQYASFWGWPLKTIQAFFSVLAMALFWFLVVNSRPFAEVDFYSSKAPADIGGKENKERQGHAKNKRQFRQRENGTRGQRGPGDLPESTQLRQRDGGTKGRWLWGSCLNVTQLRQRDRGDRETKARRDMLRTQRQYRQRDAEAGSLSQAAKKEILNPLFLLLASVFLVALFGILQLYGKHIFPWQFARTPSFNTIGTTNAWAIFLAILLPILTSLLYLTRAYLRWFLGAIFLLSFLGIFLVNFWIAWLVLLAGMAIILVFGMAWPREMKKAWLILPTVLLAIALLFGIFRFPIRGLPTTTLELSPSYTHTFEIAGKVLKEKPVLGSGPGTFVYDFSRHKSPTLNQTIFWNIRFNSGASEIFERLATFGILGIIAFLGLIGSFLFAGFRGLNQFASRIDRPINNRSAIIDLAGLGIFSSFFALCVGFFLYPSNLSLEFLFWFLGAGLLALNQGKANSYQKSLIFKGVKTWQLERGRVSSILVSLSFIISLILGIALFAFGGQRYFAQVRYFQGLKAFASRESQIAVAKILRATQLEPSTDAYWRDLSQVAIVRLQEEMAMQDLTQEEITQRIQAFFNLTINSAKRATDTGPNNVANWQARGFAFRNSIGLAQGSFAWALKSYERAKELEPTNPFIDLETARTYLAQASLMRQLQETEQFTENLEKAEESLERAIALKQDYWPAHFQKALLFDIQGKLAEAIAKLEEIKPFNQQDVGLAFQLGSLYWRGEELKKAKAEFERAVQLSPAFSNARYFLGLIYDKEGNKEKAIEEFEKIASFSQENKEQVAEILENLKAGKPALGEEAEVPPEPEEIPALEEE